MQKLGLSIFLILMSSLTFAADFNHEIWNTLLKKNVVIVRNGQANKVNYEGFLSDQMALKKYLKSTSRISKSEFNRWNKQQQLAFLINLYNAQTIELVLTEYPVDSIKDIGSVFSSAWKKEFISLFGELHSLDYIEQDLIRADNVYQEPRIHFALNCASIGCPALSAEAYNAKKLSTQLDEATRLFLSDRSRNYLKNNTLTLSSIFDWYQEDFERGWSGFHSLIDFLDHYKEAVGLTTHQIQALNQNTISIEYGNYDWRLNKIY